MSRQGRLGKFRPNGCDETNSLRLIKLEREAARGDVNHARHLKHRFEANALLADVLGRPTETGLGTLANLADCSNIALSEASLITINP